MVFIMSSDYSCFNAPVDLSLSGSQVSPTHRPVSARSVSSARSSMSARSRDGMMKDSKAKTSHAKTSVKVAKAHGKPRLAMSFPAKENQKPKQTNLAESLNSVSDDYLSNFFVQPKTTPNDHDRKSKKTPGLKRNLHVPKSKVQERVFNIPDSVRSSVTTARSERSAHLDQRNDSSPPDNFSVSDIDYLKSYLSNVDKYRDGSEDDVKTAISEQHMHGDVTSITSPARGYRSTEEVDGSEPLTTSMLETDPGERAELRVDEHADEDVAKFKRTHAARVIQRHYRRHLSSKTRREKDLKALLALKKMEKQTFSLRGRLRSEDEVRKQRAEKAKEARKKAIEELQKKRDAEREAVKKVAEEEVERVRRKMEERSQAKKRKNRERNDAKAAGDAPGGVGLNKPSEVNTREEVVFPEVFVDGSERLTSGAASDETPVQGEVPKQRSTLDDVLETIKLLEEEPQQLKESKPSRSALEEKLSWIDELQSEHNSVVSKSSAAAAPMKDPNNLLTEAKLHSIMNYLDEVEKKSPPPSQLDTVDATQQLIQAENAATEVTSQMLKMKLDLEEKTKSVALLQKALVQQRELSVKQAQEQEKELQHRTQLQKKQYESTIQRHLSFIDQLIDDKKLLNDKCEKLLLDMKQSDGRYQNKIKQIIENHQIELKKAKDLMSATEKVRREKWIEEKTTKIKEMTVKGLEPEIQRLILKHKEEVKKIKAIHEAELLQSDERAGQRYIRQTEELREQLEREKEAACSREREMARQRYEMQMEQEEVALQQQRKRMFAEVAEEKERMAQQAARQRTELDQLKQQLEENSKIASSTLREEYERNMADAARRHADEMQALRERLEIEKQAWQENYMKKQEAFLLQKERELKEAVRRDRDKEIDLVIHRLEEDMHQQREEHEKATENRIKRVRDKYESEMKELERSERHVQEKYNNMKADYNRIEGENLQLQSLCKQKEQEVIDANKIKDKLVEERGNVTEVIRQEFADRLVLLEEDNKRMKTELSEMRARHRLELERINNEKEEELSEVHKRVRQAIVKKEETISQIREQHEAACKRADHLEALLEAQRKKLLGKKK